MLFWWNPGGLFLPAGNCSQWYIFLFARMLGFLCVYVLHSTAVGIHYVLKYYLPLLFFIKMQTTNHMQIPNCKRLTYMTQHGTTWHDMTLTKIIKKSVSLSIKTIDGIIVLIENVVDTFTFCRIRCDAFRYTAEHHTLADFIIKTRRSTIKWMWRSGAWISNQILF